MKKISISLATLALSASASAFVGHIDGPHRPSYESKTYCLSLFEDAHGAKHLDTCDESQNNRARNLQLNSAGCAKGQAALTTSRQVGDTKPFSPFIRSCHAPNIAQL